MTRTLACDVEPYQMFKFIDDDNEFPEPEHGIFIRLEKGDNGPGFIPCYMVEECREEQLMESAEVELLPLNRDEVLEHLLNHLVRTDF